MSVKEALLSSRAKFVDATPKLPDGVRLVVTREHSASEVSREVELLFKKHAAQPG